MDKNRVKMYTCGVTTYDDCHIGHGRSLYIFDVIRRYLEHKGFQVDFVRNITDIDDKIINRAREIGIGWKELSDRYIAGYKNDLKNLELMPAVFEPRATENIQEMIESVEKLIEKGYAYQTETGVYFQVRKMKGYGSLSGQKIDDMKDAVRINPDEKKKDPLDFALWKKSSDDEPGWMSPWGRGRPGWHIECSVMSQKYLKRDTLDIHGGGRDLIFPHHENECAQSIGLSGKKLANYWLHHGLLTIEGRKMSKSLGNFVTLSEIFKKYQANVLKIFYLQAHYSSSIDFSWEKMEEAKKAYGHIAILKDKLDNYLKDQGACAGKKLKAEVKLYLQEFNQAMDDDFNTSRGLAALFELISQANRKLAGDDKNKKDFLLSCRQVLGTISAIFGFTFSQNKISGITEKEINSLIAQRNQCRKNKQFQEADKIRGQLLDKGIILEDSKEGTIWRRK